MIKANKGMVHMEGKSILLEAELMTVVKGLYKAIAGKYGEEFAKKRLEAVFDAAMETEKEEEAEEEALEVKLEGDKAEKFAEAFLKTLAAAVERKGEE